MPKIDLCIILTENGRVTGVVGPFDSDEEIEKWLRRSPHKEWEWQRELLLKP